MDTTHRDFAIAPNIDELGDLTKYLPFLNLYKERGFCHLEKLLLKKRFLPDVMQFFSSLGAIITKLKGENCFNVELKYQGSEIVVYLRDGARENGRMLFFATTNSTEKILLQFLNEVPTEDVSESTCLDLSYYFLSKREGLTKREMYVNVGDFANIYTDLYPDIDIIELMRQYNNANEPILMLYGEPGVGKTTFVKYMIAHGDFQNAAYIKDPAAMEDGELWGSLTSHHYDLVVFDDLDNNLLPRRKNADSTFMTQLLSYSDGIFTQGRVKIIITTNQAVKEIDSALVRPGRCFDFLKLNTLDNAHARNFWINTLNLNPDNFDAIFGKENITQAALMSEAFRMQASAGARSYVKRGKNIYTLDTKLSDLGIKSSDGESDRASF